ncbi:unnamed protein product [Trichogramma brassicae]|uniref:NR LBD domain-containing protein n=1 Tax=Trichogramma brassicae TaxID=86971 RepID=A0A6H5J1L4_9HYME|nr:unnamed protein product [Trichogramma brassicae]
MEAKVKSLPSEIEQILLVTVHLIKFNEFFRSPMAIVNSQRIVTEPSDEIKLIILFRGMLKTIVGEFLRNNREILLK